MGGLRREPSCHQIVLGRNAEGVGDAVEECEQGNHIHRFGYLILAPAGFAQLLYVGMGGTRCRVSDQRCVIQQSALGRSQFGLFEFAFGNGANCLIGSSLDTQEVGVAIDSIRTAIE